MIIGYVLLFLCVSHFNHVVENQSKVPYSEQGCTLLCARLYLSLCKDLPYSVQGCTWLCKVLPNCASLYLTLCKVVPYTVQGCTYLYAGSHLTLCKVVPDCARLYLTLCKDVSYSVQGCTLLCASCYWLCARLYVTLCKVFSSFLQTLLTIQKGVTQVYNYSESLGNCLGPACMFKV